MTQNMQILEGLNESQKQAVKHVKGSEMVIAGAGSGKTKVLTHRIAYMIANGVDPYRILALTFTNKAAAEMRERICKLIGDALAKQVWMGTFHSMFSRILRIEAQYIGYTPKYTIYDTEDSKNLIKQIVKEFGLDSKTYTPSLVLGRISQSKSNLISDEQYNRNADIQKADSASGKSEIGRIFKMYNMRLKQADAMDFEDLLYYINVLFRDYPDVLMKYQTHFHYIMVDEYQDTNYAQYIIIKKLSALHKNICVVGDDAQSIYGFRGANIENIFNFKRDFPEHEVYKLEQNYRSTQTIVKAANSVISYNQKQIRKEIWTDNESGGGIYVVKTKSDQEEGKYIAESIYKELKDNKLNYSDFAILYRTNVQSRSLEEALRRLNMPYRIYGGLAFYKRKEIKDLLAYFRLTVNFQDGESLRRIINYPQRGIGQTTVEKLIATAKDFEVSMWNIIENPYQYQLDVPNSMKERLKDFCAKIKSFSALQETKDAYTLAVYIFAASGMSKNFKDDPEAKERLEHIEELLNSIQEFCNREDEEVFDPFTGEIIPLQEPTLSRFLESISLLTDEDEDKSGNENKVKLMTIHASKGLEFNHVYISGMEENLFPSALSIGSRSELEEERRLFYVALTRACKKVTLTYANTRFKNGSFMFGESSRFIDEIDQNYLIYDIKSEPNFFAKKQLYNASENINTMNFVPTVSLKPTFKPIQKAAATSTMFTLKNKGVDTKTQADYLKIEDVVEGLEVIHDKFGNGKVLKVEQTESNAKATVHFTNFGNKVLLLSFAKLRKK